MAKKRKRTRKKARRRPRRPAVPVRRVLEEEPGIDAEDIPKELDRINQICQRAVALYERGDYRAAMAEINKAIASPMIADKPHYFKGMIAAELSRYEEAAYCFKVFLTFHPGEPEALFNYGSAVRNMGYLDYALEVYDEVLRRNPEPGLRRRAEKVRQDTLLIKELLKAGQWVAFAPGEPPLRAKKGKPPEELLVEL